MSIKAGVKRILGRRGTETLRRARAQYKYLRCKRSGGAGVVKMRGQIWGSPAVYCQPGKHVFFGYYDLQQLNTAKDKMLVTVIPQNADTKKDLAELGWYSLEDGKYHAVTTTAAWCWQQGARLRWHPTEPGAILYNDVKNDHYVLCSVSLQTGQVTRVAERACYDVTQDMRYGLSLNYSRLQRLRPGYGYDKLPDLTEEETVPEGDGIFLVDLAAGESRLIVSYQQLAELSPGSENEWNYINHISIAPGGDRFMFFHLWTPAIGARWKAKLYVANLDGSGLRCLEEEYSTSHYCWKNSRELLTTTVGVGGERSYYFHYDVDSGKRTELQSEHLTHDGHPSWLSDGDHFITDTYPLEHSIQHLFSESARQTDYAPICDLFSDPRLYGEKRCDLHPRLTKDNTVLTVDSTFQNGTRSVLLFRRKM